MYRLYISTYYLHKYMFIQSSHLENDQRSLTLTISTANIIHPFKYSYF